jgi:hypothetical protein
MITEFMRDTLARSWRKTNCAACLGGRKALYFVRNAGCMSKSLPEPSGLLKESL